MSLPSPTRKDPVTDGRDGIRDRSAGRLTLVGGAQTEETLSDLVRKSVRVILRFVPKDNLKTLALVGDYGRGEGGVRAGRGGERPAYPLDLLLITAGLRPESMAEMRSTIDAELDHLRRRFGIGVGLAVVDAGWMERDHGRLVWYEARHGHKPLAGDPRFLPGLTRFTVASLDPAEMGDLVVSRGALIVMSELILAQRPLTEARRRFVMTQTAKAVIGYGDAFLFFRGAYHWSYVERRRRMADRSVAAPPEFGALYDLAMHYRFGGDAPAGDRLILEIQSGHLRRVLSAVHLEIETRRLRARRLDFNGYVRTSFQRELAQVKSSVRKLALGALALIGGGPRIGQGSPHAVRMALLASGEPVAVRALFPLIAYGKGDSVDMTFARRLLGVRKARSGVAKLAWLRMWERVFNPHLGNPLSGFGLSAEPAR